MSITIIDRTNRRTRGQRAEAVARRLGLNKLRSAEKYRPDLVRPEKEMTEEAREQLADRGFFKRD